MNTKCPKYLNTLSWFPFNKYMMNLNFLEYIIQFSTADLAKLYSLFSEKKKRQLADTEGKILFLYINNKKCLVL